jgi:translation initiation factor eIF-2B subunit epsilon
MGERHEHEAPLQAIILADSFTTRFRPITLESPPKALLPLCNVAMIEYTLEVLAAADVKEILVVCSNYGGPVISEYLDSRRPFRGEMFPEIQVVGLANVMSAGQALRFVHEKDIIRSNPFILIHSDVVSNLDLKTVIKQHKNQYFLQFEFNYLIFGIE